MRAGGHFTALNVQKGNHCNEPLSYFFRLRQSRLAVFFVCKERITVEKIKGDIYGWKRLQWIRGGAAVMLQMVKKELW